MAQRLTAPRGLIFDSAGGLLVVQQEKGIVRLTFAGNNSACPSTQQADVVVDASVSSDSNYVDIITDRRS